MYISGIKMNTNTAFGYNKKLHRELKRKIIGCQDNLLADTLYTQLKYCDNMESQIVWEESQGAEPEETKIDALIKVKKSLCDVVSLVFPELHYVEREKEQYLKEHEVYPGLWRKKLCDELNISAPLSSKNIKKPDTAPLSPVKTEDKSSESYDDIKTKDAVMQVLQEGLVEKYMPEESSPRGFLDVAGMEKLKSELEEDIIFPVRHPDEARQNYIDYEIRYPRGIILYGPPGCGKSYITQALAAESDADMYKLSIGNAGSSYINKTAANIKRVFDFAGYAGQNSDRPVFLLMEEVEALAPSRDSDLRTEEIKQVNTLLESMDAVKDKNVVVIATTNKPFKIDTAFFRRFDKKAFVSLPDEESRKAVIKMGLQNKAKGQLLLSDEKAIENLSSMLEGYSIDAICKIIKSAAKNAMHRNRADISTADFRQALDDCNEPKYNEADYNLEEKQPRRMGF